MLKIYSLVANRRGVGIVGELESFSNINKQGGWNSRGMENFPNNNTRGRTFQNFKLKAM